MEVLNGLVDVPFDTKDASFLGSGMLPVGDKQEVGKKFLWMLSSFPAITIESSVIGDSSSLVCFAYSLFVLFSGLLHVLWSGISLKTASSDDPNNEGLVGASCINSLSLSS